MEITLPKYSMGVFYLWAVPILQGWVLNLFGFNITKHGIDFLQASTVFKDTSAIVMEDIRHDYGESRYQIIGAANPLGIVFVVFAEREGNIIRIISARKASKWEKRLYQQNT